MSSLARRFHDETTHTPYSVRTSGHTLDWDVKPFPFKVYTEVPGAAALARGRCRCRARRCRCSRASPRAAPRLTLEALTALLYYSAGVTRKKTYPGRRRGALPRRGVHRRAVPDRALRGGGGRRWARRPGSITSVRVTSRCGGCAAGTSGRRWPPRPPSRRWRDGRRPSWLSAIFWRNTWKYQARGYRHLFWDSGTMLANTLAVGRCARPGPACAHGLRRRPGQSVPRPRSQARGGAGAGRDSDPRGRPRRRPGPAGAGARRHAAVERRGRLSAPARDPRAPPASPAPTTVIAWRRATAPPAARAPGSARPAARARARRAASLGETIQRRGSTRRFAHEPLSAAGARHRAVGRRSAVAGRRAERSRRSLPRRQRGGRRGARRLRVLAGPRSRAASGRARSATRRRI